MKRKKRKRGRERRLLVHNFKFPQALPLTWPDRGAGVEWPRVRSYLGEPGMALGFLGDLAPNIFPAEVPGAPPTPQAAPEGEGEAPLGRGGGQKQSPKIAFGFPLFFHKRGLNRSLLYFSIGPNGNSLWSFSNCEDGFYTLRKKNIRILSIKRKIKTIVM